MGKTVAAVAGAVLAIGIAVAAPYLAPAFLVTAFGAATATAITAAVLATALSVGMSLAFRALGVGAPSAKHQTYPQGTAVVDKFGPKPDIALEPTMPALRGSLWRRLWHGGGARFYIIQLEGDCMAPRMTDPYVIADTKAEIRRGDLFSFGTKDHAKLGYSKSINGIAKRFEGVNRELKVLECTCSNPPSTIHAGLTNLLWAHRICATAPTLKEAQRLLWKVRWSPKAIDRPVFA